MDNTSEPTGSGTASNGPVAGPSSPTSAASEGKKPAAPAFRIRYGRTALAVVGLAALLTAVVSTVVSVAGFAPAYLPILTFLVALASVVALRAMAIRSRSKRSAERVESAFREAMSPGVATRTVPADNTSAPEAARPTEPKSGAPKKTTKLFDAESDAVEGETGAQARAEKPAAGPEQGTGSGTAGEGVVRPQSRLTAAELRKAALAVAAESGEKPAEAPQNTWEPVDVPKPKYVESAKADRPAPEPLDLPAEPKPEGKPSIKSGAVAPRVDVQNAQAAGTSDQKPSENPEPSKPATGLHNLDDVLQRRRA